MVQESPCGPNGVLWFMDEDEERNCEVCVRM
jgi:hypothetical protein